MKKIITYILFASFLILVGCSSEKDVSTKSGNNEKNQVIASFYPVAEFARNIGKDKVEVITMVPAGAEPHDWEPSAKDVGQIQNAKLFFYNGGGIEPWAKNIQLGKTTTAVEVGAGMFDIDGKTDPHIWVSPKKAIKMVERIRDNLQEKDSANKTYYTQNAAAYIAELKALDEKLEKIATAGKRKDFITLHAAFGHLAKDYSLVEKSIVGLHPDAEPTPADLAKLVTFIKENNIKYIFFEELVDPKVATTLAKTANVETLVLDPLEGLTSEGQVAGLTYLKIMEQNIKNLEKALN